jgi:hypothetical protein
VHHSHGLDRVVTLGSLTRQHDAVSSIENGVANVADFGTGGAGVVGHGLQHLGGTDGGLACNVALCDHHLLGDEDLAGRDLDTKVTTGNHDTVGLPEDLVKVVQTLLVLDLGNDLDVLAILAEDLTDGRDIATMANEGGEDHVDAVLDTKAEIGLVLLGERGKIDVGLGKVDTLLGRNLAVVDALALEGLVVNYLKDLEGQDTIVDVDDAAGRDDLCDVLVVDVPSEAGMLAKAELAVSRGTHMFLLSLLVAYWSSVVMLMMSPAAMGMSASSTVLPVRISGPFVSRAMASGLPAWSFSALRALSMTDWWYS